jgi:hypothetical protein
MSDLRPLLHVRVLGTPRPKGSLKFVTKSYAKEQVAGSPDWRSAVASVANGAISCQCPENCGALNPGFPYDGPVKVLVRLEFLRPKGAKDGALPSTRNTGDIDKHMRNIFDALQDAGVLKDDAQIVDQCSSKRYSTTGVAGAVITVWPAAFPDSAAGAAAINSPTPAAIAQPTH